MCYGVGLSDCWPPTSTPSKLCWPEIVAKELGYHCVNMSTSGFGNKAIWYRIKNFKFKKDDLVLILWTFPNRYTLIESPNNIKNLHHNNYDSLSVAYYNNLYNEYDSQIMSELFVDHANYILHSKKVNFYQMAVKKRYWKMFKDHDYLKITMDAYETLYPRALDNSHAGIEGHRAFSKDLLDMLGYENNLSKLSPPKLINKIKFPLWKLFIW